MDSQQVSGRGTAARPLRRFGFGRFLPILAGALLASCLIWGLAEADKLAAAAEPQEEKQDGFKRLTGPIFDIIKGEEEPAAPEEAGAGGAKAGGSDPGAEPADSAAGGGSADSGSAQEKPAETPPASPYGPPPDALDAPVVSPYGPPPDDVAAPPAEALAPVAPAGDGPKEAPPSAVETAPAAPAAAPPATPPAADIAPESAPISPYGAPPEEAVAAPPVSPYGAPPEEAVAAPPVSPYGPPPEEPAATTPAAPSVAAPPALAPPALAPPAEAGQVAQPLQAVQELLRKKPAPEIAEMEALLKRLEATPASEEATFLLVRSLARRVPSYHLRLGAFFDPLDKRPKGQMEPNVQFAYEEYSLASDLPEAKERIKALTAYLDTPEAQGVAGLSSLKAQLGK